MEYDIVSLNKEAIKSWLEDEDLDEVVTEDFVQKFMDWCGTDISDWLQDNLKSYLRHQTKSEFVMDEEMVNDDAY